MEAQELQALCKRTELIGCRILVTEIMATTNALVVAITVKNDDELHIKTRDAKRRLRPGQWEDDPYFELSAVAKYCAISEANGTISINFFDVEAKIYTPESGNA